jgi:hypothetical protein
LEGKLKTYLIGRNNEGKQSQDIAVGSMFTRGLRGFEVEAIHLIARAFQQVAHNKQVSGKHLTMNREKNCYPKKCQKSLVGVGSGFAAQEKSRPGAVKAG